MIKTKWTTHCLLVAAVHIALAGALLGYSDAATQLQPVLEVEHAVDVEEFEPRGLIPLADDTTASVVRLQTSKTAAFTQTIDAQFEDKLRKSAHRGGNYRLRARLALVDHGNSVVHSSPWMHSMMKSCSLVAADLKHAIALQQDSETASIDLSKDTEKSFWNAANGLRSIFLRLPRKTTPCLKSDEEMTGSMVGAAKGRVEFHTFPESKGFDEEPLGNTGPHPGQQRLYADEFGHAVKSPRAKAKMEEEEQSFMQRYGHIIIPVVIGYVILNVFAAPEEGEAAQAAQSAPR